MRTITTLLVLATFALGCDDRGGEAQGLADKQDVSASVASLQQARLDSTELTIKAVVQALEMYKVQHGEFPTTEQGLQVLVDQRILSALKGDAWGHPLVYARNGGKSFTLNSLGADGKPGGQGFDADIEMEY